MPSPEAPGQDGPPIGSAALLFWIWMLRAGVLLWIHAPKRVAVAAEEPVSAIQTFTS